MYFYKQLQPNKCIHIWGVAKQQTWQNAFNLGTKTGSPQVCRVELLEAILSMRGLTSGDAHCVTNKFYLHPTNHVVAKQYTRKIPTTWVMTCRFDEQDTFCSHTFQPLVFGCLKNQVQRLTVCWINQYNHPNHYFGIHILPYRILQDACSGSVVDGWWDWRTVQVENTSTFTSTLKCLTNYFRCHHPSTNEPGQASCNHLYMLCNLLEMLICGS